ncbi:hypothetical protein TNCT_473341 [Trichonephila clavata]|uniref:DNA replication ATP-dependent helicase/nuclease n=2 Tax=Trichonephila clavata TaxID=2740835 RepID=A0A8X6KHI7_TRICU|nr:hypothetical protein TNCT_473341 [Trichonephila clavata]
MLEENSKELSEGLLLYLRDIANMKLVSVNHNSLRGLIQLRNELAFYTSRWISRSSTQIDDIENCHLPKPLNNKKFCGKCPYLLPCTVYQRALSEDKDLEVDHAMKSLITPTTSHLKHSHLQYFVHWSNLLLIESSNVAITNAFWTEESTSREKKGMCLSWLSLDKNAKQNEEINETFSATFCRSAKSPITSSLASVGLKTGDYIAVSKQGSIDEVAITMGYIVKILEESVTIISDRDFSKVSKYEDYIFRIDKQISNSATACIRNNLMCLMNNDSEALELRKFVIDKHPPSFAKSLPKDVVLNGRPILKELNKVQQRVVLKALMSQDYLIIKGMPGTGKTSTIVALVRLLSSMGNSVLLTSYTHSAIDNILLKLKDHMSFVRIGQEGRIHPNLKEFSFENWTKDFSTVNQFKTFMNEQMVVATTCLGINHAIFKVRKFDICIVDEASQINQIACLGPLFHAKKFILVGDDKQLPPLVVNEKAREKGMQESLLQRLCNADNSIELVIQYRMNKEIMRFCNELTYNGALQCGSETVAQSVLKLDISSIRNSTPGWVLQALQVDLQKSVIFINTEKVNSFSSGMSLDKNEFESEIVVTILQTLSKLKVAECDIGIITPYRRQVDLIATKLKHISMNEIEVNTVDQYQGRDKSVIIISCVKCNKSTTDCDKKGVIINEERRLNVAISRAKRKLIIIGCKSSLIMYKPFEKLIKSFAAEQIIELSSDSFPS